MKICSGLVGQTLSDKIKKEGERRKVMKRGVWRALLVFKKQKGDDRKLIKVT